MINKILFTKMHGAGNDYIYVNTLQYPVPDPQKRAVLWSAYHTGIGSDGLVLIGTSWKADFSMRIFNADGSEAKMCGNASRCVGKYLYENGLTDKTEISLETLSGIKYLKLQLEDNKVIFVKVDMGIPEVGVKDMEVEGYRGTFVSMGNPHFVVYVDDVASVDLSCVGPFIEHSSFFSDRVNVEFAQIISENQIRMRVWERGSGITKACGTGACATLVAGVVRGLTGRNVKVLMDGGALDISWNGEGESVYMKGDAVKVFDGEIEI